MEGKEQGGASAPPAIGAGEHGGETAGTLAGAPAVASALQDACVLNGAPAVAPRNGHGAGDRAYAALDLGTNNCRLLVARPAPRGFRVVDAFSRIIRLGEGVSSTRRLSREAIERTMDALKICAAKMRRHRVERAGLIATEACRLADNAPQFLSRVRDETDLDIKVVSREAEARLAVSGCASLIDASCDLALVFDIGGGSTELIWLDLTRAPKRQLPHQIDRLEMQACIAAWTSLPVGVVTLAERHGGTHVGSDVFEAMVSEVSDLLEPFEAEHGLCQRMANRSVHLLGTSGTVTTLAGVHLGLPRYDRRHVDGCWLEVGQARAVTQQLLNASHAERVAQPCIGKDRADLVLAGCAILEALLRTWPCERMRVADRGLREGILTTLMAEDGVYPAASGYGRR